MKPATLPEVAVEAQLLFDLENVLLAGETVSTFVEAAVRRAIELRRDREAFNSRGEAAWVDYTRTGVSYPVGEVLAELRAMTASRRKALGA